MRTSNRKCVSLDIIKSDLRITLQIGQWHGNNLVLFCIINYKCSKNVPVYIPPNTEGYLISLKDGFRFLQVAMVALTQNSRPLHDACLGDSRFHK